jgi:hypothetical protein
MNFFMGRPSPRRIGILLGFKSTDKLMQTRPQEKEGMTDGFWRAPALLVHRFEITASESEIPPVLEANSIQRHFEKRFFLHLTGDEWLDNPDDLADLMPERRDSRSNANPFSNR